MRNALQMIFLLFVIVSPTHGQSITTGAVQGVVTDVDTDEPLGGVSITIGNQTQITDDQGHYKITELLPGTYDVEFEFATTKAVHSGVIVGANNTTSVYQALKIGESIHIIGDPPPINTISHTHEKRIGRPELEHLPIPGVNATDATGQVPGSSNDGRGTAYSGSTSLENRYLVDGIDITGLTYGDVGTPVLNDFVHEIQAITGGYDAQYGRSTGGIVNIITRSGTDQFRGSVFGLARPGFLSVRGELAPSNSSSIDVTSDNAYSGHFGFELGGPIVKKRAWYYLGVAPQLSRTDYTRITKRQTDCRLREDSGALSTCQSSNADGVPDVDPETGFFITDELDRETRSATSQSTTILAKVNVAATKNDQAQLSLIALPSASRTPALLGLPSTGQRAWGLTTDTAARWTSKLGDGATEVEALIAWHRSTLNTGSIDPTADTTPLQVLLGGDLARISNYGGESAATAGGCADNSGGDPYTLITNCPSTQYSIGGPGSLSRDLEERRAARVGILHRIKMLGSHELKAGLDIEDDHKRTTRAFSGGGYVFNFGSAVEVHRYVELAPPGSMDPRYDRVCTTPDPEGRTDRMLRCRYIGGLEDPSTRIDGQTVNWGAYIQDSWQPLRGLTLNAGLRYEEQRLRYAARLRNTIDALTGNRVGDTAMTLTGNFAPRLGVVYDPTHEGRAKIYGAWGRYFEGIPMDINDRSFGSEVSQTQLYANGCGPIDPRTGFSDGAKCLTTPQSPDAQNLLGSSGVLVAPGIKAQYLDESMIGAELALPSSFVFGAAVQNRRLGRVIEDVSTDGANTYIIANPGEWSTDEERKLEQQIASTEDKAERDRLQQQLQLYRGIRSFDKPVRDYTAIELSLGRRFASGLYLNASYTYSRTDGNYPGLISYDNGQVDPNISSQYDLIELLANRRGPLPQDRPHYIKVDAYRTFELGKRSELTIGGRVRALSGIPRNALGAHYLYGADESFLLPRGSLGRTEFEHGIDLHVGYKHALPHNTAAELFVDVFNVYNRQGTFRVDETYAPQYSSTGSPQNVNPISGGSYEDLIWAKAIDNNGGESAVPTGRNPNFGNTTARYAPAAAQVGFRVTF